MKKLSIYFLLLAFLSSCTTIKYVPENELLLTDNIVYIDSVKTSKDEINELLLQRPNAKSLNLPLSLFFYNLGNPNGPQEVIDWKQKHLKTYEKFKTLFSEKQSISIAQSAISFNNWFIENGEAPVIINDKKIKSTVKNLKNYFFTEGYFRAKTSAKKDTIGHKKGLVKYYISKGEPSILDTVYTTIKSPTLDSLYKTSSIKTHLKKGDTYKNSNFIKETKRIIKLYRNKGIYHFNENNISFNNDTLNNYKKTNVEIAISDRLIEKNGSYISKPFKTQKIKNINVVTDYLYNLRDKQPNDSTTYKGVNYFAYHNLNYNPKYLSQSIFIKPGQLYTDSLRNLTRTHLRGLKNFKSTAIRYNELNDNELEATILLTPIEKYTLGLDTELSRSNLKTFDISTEFSISNRNTFKGAEIFKFSVLGAYFNSSEGPGWEIGGNISLEVPRFMIPFGLSKLVPKRMSPKTTFFTGISIQKNIALDKQNISIGIDYKWQYNKQKSIEFEFFNTQYIRNLNVDNYFTIYNSEFNDLENVITTYNETIDNPDNQLTISTDDNVNDIIQTINTVASDTNFQTSNPTEFQDNLNILNRFDIITSDFLIPEIAYTYTFNNQKNINDVDFSNFRIKLINSGNVLGILADDKNAKGKNTFLKLPLAQYFKTDIEYKKFWRLGKNAVLAHRTFLGAIITYNDSDIPFSKSYFAGGSNDIRAWKTYGLGPGIRPPGLEYNIGSLKLLSSLEYRFNILGDVKGALFVDTGNIWDITNSPLVDEESKFKNVDSITDIAVGGGFGIRYDLTFLVARFDIGFKLREPYLPDNKWLQQPNFSNAVYNIGINYPF